MAWQNATATASAWSYDSFDILPSLFLAGMKLEKVFLIKSNIIEKIGINKRRTHPEISKHPYHEGYVGIHAELDCILKVDKEDLKDYKMLVLRVDRKNKLNISKPCPGCLSLINQFNVGEVWYSDKNGEIVKHNENK